MSRRREKKPPAAQTEAALEEWKQRKDSMIAPWCVVIAGKRRGKVWRRYRSHSEALSTVQRLRALGLDARVEGPEHGNDRRKFLIFALMLGAVPPQRVVERVIAEINEEESP
jgi:hypothetical protein